MGTEPFDVCQGDDDGSKGFQPVCCEFLRSDVFLEVLGIDSAELASVSICWERVICTRGVVSTTVHNC